MVRIMAKRRVRFTFPEQLITEPLIYNLGRNFEIITNIRRANVQERVGWVVLELEGAEDEIDRGLEWMTEAGVRVDPIIGDLIEG
ncbi:MAG: NIL domain-containing protein [Chloroflexi bacterium]|nr:NIL domain-containing protein [Chloroflexota bacterium]